MSDTVYSIVTDSGEVVTGCAASNCAQPGMTQVSDDVYAAVQGYGLGRCTYDEKTVAAYAPPAPSMPVATPCVTGRQMNGQARVAGITAALNTVLTSMTSTAKPDDIRYVNSVGLDTRMPIDNPKAARVLTLAGVQDVPAFMQAALLLVA